MRSGRGSSTLNKIWHSAIKEGGTYPAAVKAKINVSGPRACRIVGMDGNAMAWPDTWSRLAVLPVLEVRGIYCQTTGSGLVLEVTHLMVSDTQAETSEFL